MKGGDVCVNWAGVCSWVAIKIVNVGKLKEEGFVLVYGVCNSAVILYVLCFLPSNSRGSSAGLQDSMSLNEFAALLLLCY